jgi:hypothetical protein
LLRKFLPLMRGNPGSPMKKSTPPGEWMENEVNPYFEELNQSVYDLEQSL